MEGKHNKTVADLRKLQTFSDLPDNVLQWILEHTEHHLFEANTLISNVGDSIDEMFILFRGEYVFYLESNGRVVSTVSFKAGQKFGEVGGLLPYSKMKSSPGKAFTATETDVLLMHKKHFHELELLSPELIERLVDLLKERIRYFTSLDNQMDKMSALGKLSAGLAHELNNPSAAIVRNAKELKSQIFELPELMYQIIRTGIKPEVLQSIYDNIQEINKSKQYKSLLEKQRAEDSLNGWLEEKNIKDAWIISETFAESGLSINDLENLATMTVDGQLEPVLKYFAIMVNIDKMIDETCIASEHISKLVTAVKSFSHMDRGDSRQYADILPGIENTLTLLDHKIKKKSIQVHLNNSEKLPKISIWEGELNQVWNNLVDNAIDAMEENGLLTINLNHDHRFMNVEINDSGKGIPPEIIKNIFDPFFTTKGIGEGTGLGLDVVNRIINKHEGTIKVQSKPGNTLFTVALPIHPITKQSEDETANHISN